MPNSQARRWCFTINNPTDADEARLTSLESVYLIFGREVSASGTPHLQGFVIFARPCRFTLAKSRIGDQAHIEVTRGTTDQAATYCKKDGDFVETGTIPASPGKRNDWEDYKQYVRDLGRIPNRRELINHNTSLYARYSKALVEVAQAVLDPPSLTLSEPRLGWQTEVSHRIGADIFHPRKIDFVVDPVGNSGKSWLCQWALTKYPDRVQVLCMGKRDDLAHAIDANRDIFLIDVPRKQMEFLQYAVLEMLKNRMVFSPKYNSTMKLLGRVPYVAVFSNEEPDESSLSEDRFNIINV